MGQTCTKSVSRDFYAEVAYVIGGFDDINKTNEKGQSLAMQVILEGGSPMDLAHLINAGADLDIVDNFGKTIYDYARQRENSVFELVLKPETKVTVREICRLNLEQGRGI